MNKCIVVTNPMIAANKSAEVTLSKFLRVIAPAYGEISVVGGNVKVEKDLSNIVIRSFEIKRSPNKIKRLLDILRLQCSISTFLRKDISENEHIYFWVADKMLLPFWMAKMKKADIRYFIYGNVLKEGTPRLFTKLSGKLIAYMANHADSVCVESPSVINEWNGVIKNKSVRAIHLYTEIGELNPIENRENIVGMLCRLTEGKHVLDSIQAFHEYHKTHPDYKLEIIGSGRQEIECRKKIAVLHAEDYIRLLGWVEHTAVIDKTKKWKYLLFPTDTEGMPNSVLEMMGQGIPAIASPAGGIRDIIKDGFNGWILQSTAKNDILQGLEKAIPCDSYLKIAIEAQRSISEGFVLEAAQKNAMQNM